MANIQSRIVRWVQKFYSWDIKLISQSEIISMGYRLSGDTKGFGIYECFDTLQYAHEFGDVAHPILQAITPQAFDDLHRDLRIN